MATLDVVTTENQKAGSVELDPVVFEAPVKPHLFHAEVRRQLARRHRGTHASRNRSAASGGGDKPWRQKGTGRARQGSTRAPQWEGGGAVFGPVPRSYEHSLPKKVRRAALRSALSLRQREGDLVVVDALPFQEYRTRPVAEMLGALGLGETGVLIVIPEAQPFVEMSARNLAGVSVLRVAGLNVYDVLRHPKLLITKDAVAAIEARLGEARS